MFIIPEIPVRDDKYFDISRIKVFMNLGLILEAINYDQMFDNLRNTKGIYPDAIHLEIKWAKQYLKKNDRIIWWLRQYKIWYIIACYFSAVHSPHKDIQAESEQYSNLFVKEVTRYNAKTKGDKYSLNIMTFSNTTTLRNLTAFRNDIMHRHHELNHYLDQHIPEIQNYIFGWENYFDLISKFARFEEKWNAEKKQIIVPDADAALFLDVGDGYAWYDLGKGFCQQEGNAMGHCGNISGKHRPYETILSLRKKIENTDKVKPELTFILDKNHGTLGEMKGRGNDKPSAKFHKYIIQLLKDPRIEGIEGGGYLPQNNFSLADLPHNERLELVKMKPELMDDEANIEINGFNNPRAINYIIRTFGIIDVIPNNSGPNVTIRIDEYKNLNSFVHNQGQDDSWTEVMNILNDPTELESSLDDQDLDGYITDDEIKLLQDALKNQKQTVFDFVDLTDKEAVLSLITTHYQEFHEELVKAMQEANVTHILSIVKEAVEKGVNEYDDRHNESNMFLEFEDDNNVTECTLWTSIDTGMIDTYDDLSMKDELEYMISGPAPYLAPLDIDHDIYKEIDQKQFTMRLKELIRDFIK